MKTTTDKQQIAKSLGLGTAALALGGTADGSFVQINYSGIMLQTGPSVNTLITDFTGDGVSDLYRMGTYVASGFQIDVYGAQWNPSGGGHMSSVFFAEARHITGISMDRFDVHIGGAAYTIIDAYSPSSVTGLSSGFKFSDSGINGGAPTMGWLELTARNIDGDTHQISFNRFIFDPTNPNPATAPSVGASYTAWTPVPEPSGLALLALGAGGIALRRKRAA